jgi:hypothetical protein
VTERAYDGRRAVNAPADRKESRERTRTGKQRPRSPRLTLYSYIPHPHIARRREQGPVKIANQLPRDTSWDRFNTWLAVRITAIVGTMLCAYLFAILALISLPSALKSANLLIIIAWIAQTFLQLVLLPIIIVGQNVQAAAADKRSEQTYLDAEAVLMEAQKIQAHLAAQDAALLALAEKLGAKLPEEPVDQKP